MPSAGGNIGQDDWIDMYRVENGLTDRQIDDVLNMMSYQGRRAAHLNPLALERTPFEEIAKARGYDDPMEYLRSPFNPKTTQYLRVTGNAPSADGAACCIVCPTEMASQFKQKPIEVLGIGASCLESMVPHLEKKATAEAARQVYETTGVKPEDLGLLLINDFILSSQLLAAEEVGYLPKGEGWKYVMEGRTAFDGDKPINTNGGRTSYGHAFGASGMADVYEAVLQMRGQAGEHQVKKLPKTTMLRGFGGRPERPHLHPAHRRLRGPHMKLERNVKKFYDGLAEGVIYARKCKECGAIEFPPHYACNACGYHDTEWTTVSGRGVLKSVITPVALNANNTLAAIGPYCFGEVELEEGCSFNSTIFGVDAKNAKKIRGKLPVPVHPKFIQMDGYTTLMFEVDEEALAD